MACRPLVDEAVAAVNASNGAVPNALISGKLTDIEYAFLVEARRVFPGALQVYCLCAPHKLVKKYIALQHSLDNSQRLINVPKACLALMTEDGIVTFGDRQP